MGRRWIILAALLLALPGLTACGGGVIHTERAEPEWALVEEGAAVLSDGTAVDLWRGDPFFRWSSYRLPDGTELLEVEDTLGPEDVQVGNVDGFDQLGEAAQTSIGAYYQDQGLLYDIQTELERAYQDYRSCRDSGETFAAYAAGQEVRPTASNGRIICFETEITRSIRGRLVEKIQRNAVFDRETGERLDTESLFTVPQEEVAQRLLGAAAICDSVLREEIAAAWSPDWLKFLPERLEVFFPRGALPSQETAYGFSADYADIRDILRDWAVPEAA